MRLVGDPGRDIRSTPPVDARRTPGPRRMSYCALRSWSDIDQHRPVRRPRTARQIRHPRAHLRRRPAAAGRVRHRPERGRHQHLAVTPKHLPAGAAGVLRDGHRHRGADGHRHGPPGRPRGAAPQPVDRGPGGAGGDRQAVRGRHGHRPGDCRPDATLAEADALCAKFRISGVPVVDDAGVLLGIITNRDMRFEVDRVALGPRGDDPDAAGHRAGRGQPATPRSGCCASTRSRSCRWSTPTASSAG